MSQSADLTKANYFLLPYKPTIDNQRAHNLVLYNNVSYICKMNAKEIITIKTHNMYLAAS
jgi:hypothetical protein